MSLPLSSLCSIETDHPFVPTCPSAEHRAQRQSRMPPATRRHRRSRRAASLTEQARCYPPGAGRSLRDTALPQPGAGISRLLLAIVTSRFPMPLTVASSRPCRPKDRSGIHPVWTFTARPSAGLPPRIFRLIIGGGSAPIEGAGAQFQRVAKPSPLMAKPGHGISLTFSSPVVQAAASGLPGVSPGTRAPGADSDLAPGAGRGRPPPFIVRCIDMAKDQPP